MAIVGTAYVRVRTISDKLGGDIKKAVEGQLNDIDVDTAGKKVADNLSKSISKGVDEAAEKAGEDAKKAGGKITDKLGDGADERIKKSFASRISASFRGIFRAGGAMFAPFKAFGSKLSEIFSTAGTNISKGLSSIAEPFQRIGAMAAKAIVPIMKFGSIIGGLVTIAGPAVSALGGLVGTIGNLVGGIAVLPAFALAGAAALATLIIGFKGFSTAGGEAGELRETLKGFSDQWKDLQASVQNNLFRDLAEPISALANNYLPILKAGLSGIAESFNTLARNAVDFLNADVVQASTQKGLANTKTMLDNIAAGTASWLSGWTQLASVGSEFLPRFGQWLADLGAKFSNFIGQAGDDGIRSWIENSITAFKQLGDIIGNVAGIFSGLFSAANASGAGFLGSLQAVTQTFEDLVNNPKVQAGLSAFFTASSGAMASLLDVLGNVLPTLFENLAPILTGIGTTITTIFTTLGPTISNVVEQIAPLISGVFAQLLPIIEMLLPPIMMLVQSALPPLVEAFNQLMPIIAVIANTLLPPMISAFNSLMPIISVLVTQLMGPLSAIFQVIIEVIAELAQAILPPLIAMFGELAPKISRIIAVIAPLVKLIGAGLVGAIKLLAPIFEWAFGIITDVLGFFLDLIGKVVEAVGTAAQWISDQFTGVGTFFQDLAANIGQFFSDMWDDIVETFEMIGEFFSGMWDDIVETFDGMVSAISGFFVDMWNLGAEMIGNILEGIQTGFAAVITFFSSIPGWIWDAIVAFTEFIVGWGIQIITWIADGLNNTLNKILDFFLAIPGWVWDAVVSVWTTIIDWGEQIITWIVEGVSNTWHKITDFISDIPGWVWDGIVTVWNTIIDWGASIIDWIVEGLTNTWYKITSWFNTLPGLLWDGIVSAWESFLDFGERIVTNIVSGIVGVAYKIGDAIQNAVSNAVQNVVVPPIVGPDGGFGPLSGTVFGPISKAVAEITHRMVMPATAAYPNLYRAAAGGTFSATNGGTPIIIGEAGRSERVEPLDSNGLSARDLALINYLSGNSSGNITVRVFLDGQELHATVDSRIEANNRALDQAITRGRRATAS